MEQLQEILPKLAMYDTHRVTQRSSSLCNDQLFKAFVGAFEGHNKDLTNFRELSAQEITSKSDLKKKADELSRIALKQLQLDSV